MNCPTPWCCSTGLEANGRKGFGSRLLERALRNQDGKVTFAFDADGFRARAEFPLAF
jgi:hypothetical protein